MTKQELNELAIQLYNVSQKLAETKIPNLVKMADKIDGLVEKEIECYTEPNHWWMFEEAEKNANRKG